MTEKDIYKPLAEQPQEFWANTILYRLAKAMDYPRDENGTINADPDTILEEALYYVTNYGEPVYPLEIPE